MAGIGLKVESAVAGEKKECVSPLPCFLKLRLQIIRVLLNMFIGELEQLIDFFSEKRQDLFPAKPLPFGNSGNNGGRALSITFYPTNIFSSVLFL